MNKYGLLKFEGKYPDEFKYAGNFKLSVRAAPEPNSINWENYTISPVSRIARMFLLFLVVVFFIAITFVLSYTAKRQRDHYFSQTTCNL
jgi:hypothetical protein